MNKIIYFTLINLFICLHLQAQKPKKIFNYLLENNLNLAIEEYEKIQVDKEYDEDDKKLFEIANCLFLINKSYTKYNPILSINYFNRIKNDLNTSTKQEQIFKFLAKHDFTFEKISAQIHAEIYQEAKNLNIVESYSNALEVCSDIYRMELLQLKEEAFFQRTLKEQTISSCKIFLLNYANSKHKTEIEYLLERMLLNTAKRNQSLVDLNSFISEYPSSKLKQEAIDYRDSIVLLNVPNDYKAMSAYIKEYPNSKFNKEVLNKLPDLLYNECVKLNTIESLQKFLITYPSDSRNVSLQETLKELVYNESVQLNTVESLQKFITDYPNDLRIVTIKEKLKELVYNESIQLNTIESLQYFSSNYPTDYRISIINEKIKQIRILKGLIGEHKLTSISGEFGANGMIDIYKENGKWISISSSISAGMRQPNESKLSNEMISKLESLKIIINSDLLISVFCDNKEYFRTKLQVDGLSSYLENIEGDKYYSEWANLTNMYKKTYTSTFTDEYFYLYLKEKSNDFNNIFIGEDEVINLNNIVVKYNTKTNEFLITLHQFDYSEYIYFFK